MTARAAEAATAACARAEGSGKGTNPQSPHGNAEQNRINQVRDGVGVARASVRIEYAQIPIQDSSLTNVSISSSVYIGMN